MAIKMGDWVTASVEGAIAQYGLAKWQGTYFLLYPLRYLLVDTHQPALSFLRVAVVG